MSAVRLECSACKGFVEYGETHVNPASAGALCFLTAGCQGALLDARPSDELALGDLVILKSGGPIMTISKFDVDHEKRPLVWCVYFRLEVRRYGEPGERFYGDAIDNVFNRAAIRKIDEPEWTRYLQLWR